MKELYLFTIAIAISLLSGCSEKDPEDGGKTIPQRVDIVLTKSQTELLNSSTPYSFDLLSTVYDGKEDVFLSPLSLQAAICMTANGAVGQTQSEMTGAVGFEGKTMDDVNGLYSTLVKGLAKVDKSTTFEIANSVWADNSVTLDKNFKSVVEDCYDATCQALDLSSSASIDKINKWCSDKTHGMIPKILDSPGDFSMVLLNALYFKGIWKDKFSKSDTSPASFTSASGGKTTVQMMHQTKNFVYSEDEKGTQYCRFPYGNEAYVLDVILPKSGSDFKSFVSSFDSKAWDSILRTASVNEVIVSLPKVKYNYSTSLKKALLARGMNLSFTSSADFSNLGKPSMMVDDVLQKTAFEMDEEGAKAAAVTSVVMKETAVAPPSDQKIFTADHPFLFMIRETTSGAILFIGTYGTI